MTTLIPSAMPLDIETISGEIVATDISWDTYMAHYAADFCEWIEGIVIKMSPVYDRHDDLTQFFIMLFNAYFSHNPIGRIRVAPFVMKLKRSREPDIQVILDSNPNTLHTTFMEGAADICIEIISPESVGRDSGEKFLEYEAGGVREYWLFDPLRREARFYRLDDTGVYILQKLDDHDAYRTPLLPDFVLQVSLLWQSPPPNFLQIVDIMKTMMNKE
jgi:Uma2 family endonuclease